MSCCDIYKFNFLCISLQISRGIVLSTKVHLSFLYCQIPQFTFGLVFFVKQFKCSTCSENNIETLYKNH